MVPQGGCHLVAVQVVRMEDVTDYPKWYFGDKGARGYFEVSRSCYFQMCSPCPPPKRGAYSSAGGPPQDGPWAELADINLTNENYCGKSRGKEGPWRALSTLKPSRGRKAVVATVRAPSLGVLQVGPAVP